MSTSDNPSVEHAQDARTGDADDQAQSEQKSPEQLREEIEQTRVELGDTVEALAAKTDVKAQARDRVNALNEAASQKRDELTQAAQHKRDELLHRAKAATPESTTAGAQQLSATVQSNPLPFTAAGAFAAGLLIGWLLGRD